MSFFSSKKKVKKTKTKVSTAGTSSRKGQQDSRKKSLSELFDKHCSEDDIIGGDEMMNFCKVLGLDPTDIMMLVISWHLKTQNPCEFSRQEFVDGFHALGFGTLEDIKKGFRSMKVPLNDPSKYRDFYRFCFTFQLLPRQKSMDIDIALITWELILKDHCWFLDDWIEYVKGNQKNAVTRDTWDMFLDFIEFINRDFSNFDGADGAWPVLVDEFVEWWQENKKKK